MRRMNLLKKTVLNNIPGDHYTIEANDEIPDNSKYRAALIQDAQNQK